MDGQYLIKFCLYYIIDKIYVFIEKGHFFCKFATELQPLIYVRNWFLLNTLRMDGQNLTKFSFVYTLLLTRSGLVLYFVFHFCNRATALDLYRNWCLLNILRINGQSLTKF